MITVTKTKKTKEAREPNNSLVHILSKRIQKALSSQTVCRVKNCRKDLLMYIVVKQFVSVWFCVGVWIGLFILTLRS